MNILVSLSQSIGQNRQIQCRRVLDRSALIIFRIMDTSPKLHHHCGNHVDDENTGIDMIDIIDRDGRSHRDRSVTV
jgi:hypothetical protein